MRFLDCGSDTSAGPTPRWGIILGFFIGGIVAIALMISRLASRKTLIAFGPYLSLGGWLAWMLAVA